MIKWQIWECFPEDGNLGGKWESWELESTITQDSLLGFTLRELLKIDHIEFRLVLVDEVSEDEQHDAIVMTTGDLALLSKPFLPSTFAGGTGTTPRVIPRAYHVELENVFKAVHALRRQGVA